MTGITSANFAAFDVSRNCDLLMVDNKKIYEGFMQYWTGLWNSIGYSVAMGFRE